MNRSLTCTDIKQHSKADIAEIPVSVAIQANQLAFQLYKEESSMENAEASLTIEYLPLDTNNVTGKTSLKLRTNRGEAEDSLNISGSLMKIKIVLENVVSKWLLHYPTRNDLLIFKIKYKMQSK